MPLIKSISGIRGTIGGKPGESLTPVDIVKFLLTVHGLAEGMETKGLLSLQDVMPDDRGAWLAVL
jgi:hypothetical protein